MLKNLLKYPFVIFNFLFLIVGLIAVSVGIWICVDEKAVDQVLTSSNSNIKEVFANNDRSSNSTEIINNILKPMIPPLSYALIGVGGFIFILSFLGYCGAVCNSRCLLLLYGIVLVILVITEIALVVMYISYRPTMQKYTKQALQNMYDTKDPPRNFTKVMDITMITISCCGINDFSDFEELYPQNATEPQKIPVTCCKFNQGASVVVGKYKEGGKIGLQTDTSNFLVDKQCFAKPTDGNAYVAEGDGCFGKLSDPLKPYMVSMAVVIAILQLCGIIFSIYLFRATSSIFVP